MSNLKAYQYRLYPNKKQAEKLQWILDRARELYNAAIQERRDAYEIRIKATEKSRATSRQDSPTYS